MTSLYAVELRRFMARRLLRVITLLVIAGMLVAATIVFFKSSNSSTYVAPSVEVNVISGRLVECSTSNAGMSGQPPRGMTPEEFCNSSRPASRRPIRASISPRYARPGSGSGLS